jgi:repressor LexA
MNEQVDAKHLGSLQAHWKRHHSFPSLAKLADMMGLSGAGSVFQAGSRFADSGHLERVDGRTAPTHKFFARRVLGSVRAGHPQDVSDSDDFQLMNADDFPAWHPQRTSFVHVRSYSMTGVGLLDGDIVVVEHNTPARAGGGVVAVVDGPTTVKTQALENGQFVHEPTNSAFQTIRPGASLEVLGVVVGSFRSMRR